MSNNEFVRQMTKRHPYLNPLRQSAVSRVPQRLSTNGNTTQNFVADHDSVRNLAMNGNPGPLLRFSVI